MRQSAPETNTHRESHHVAVLKPARSELLVVITTHTVVEAGDAGAS